MTVRISRQDKSGLKYFVRSLEIYLDEEDTALSIPEITHHNVYIEGIITENGLVRDIQITPFDRERQGMAYLSVLKLSHSRSSRDVYHIC